MVRGAPLNTASCPGRLESLSTKQWKHGQSQVSFIHTHTHTHARARTHIQIFTDGNKSEHGVGAGIAIFIQSNLVHQLRYTLHNKCSNNQAEQLSIVKALEIIEKSHVNDNIPRRVRVHTNSRITLQSLKNTKHHNYFTKKKNQEESNSTWETQLDSHTRLDKGSRRKLSNQYLQKHAY
jgi:ribonuclease HI